MVCSRTQEFVRGREEISKVERHEDRHMVWGSQGVYLYTQREKQPKRRDLTPATCVCLLRDLGYIAGEIAPGRVSSS